MKTVKYQLYPYLTLAGTIPFILTAVLMLLGTPALPILGNLSDLMSIYAIVIACFMAGSYWGLHLNRKDGWALYLPLFSNIIALLMFFAYLLMPVFAFASLSIAAFVLMLLLDVELKNRAIIHSHYLIWRVVATVLASASLVVLALKG